MPFLDDFASSFTSTVNTFAGIKSDKRRLAEQQRQFDTSFGEQQRQFDTTQELEREKWDVTRPGIEAETARTREQTETLRFENDPTQRELRTRATEAQIAKVYGDIEFQQENIPLIREEVKKAAYANTPEQRELANAELKAKTDALVAGGQLNQAQADEINARIPFIPDVIESEIRSRNAKTRLDEQAGELGEGRVAIGKRLMEKWGLSPGGATAPTEGAIPETGAQNRAPSPDAETFLDEAGPRAGPEGTSIGPQSGAIPEREATIQQASVRTPPPAEGGGNVIQAQAGTRRLPLNDQTAQMLQDAGAATGLDVRVTSGAQPSQGKNRVGSHRHDEEVGAADINLIDPATGKALSMAVPAERARIADFVRAARAAGATGIGAGREYMGDSTIHVGFGSEAVWGGGGKRANAPEWLVEAYNNPSGAVGTRGRAPTPRGEAGGIGQTVASGQDLNREVVVQSGVTAGKEALKAMYASMVGGAIQTQQSQSQMRATLMGQGAASNNEMNNAHTAVQQAYPSGVKVSEAERNLATLGMAYEWALYIDQDPQKAQMYATEILQNYRQTHNQLMSFAQQSLEDGRLDQAAKLAAKAYAYIPDGQEAKFVKDKDGNYIVTTIDLATKKETSRQRVSPDEIYAKIMGWSPIEFERRLASAAGVSMPSKAFEQASGMMAGAIPEVTYEGNEPQLIPPTPQFNRAGMTSEEGSAIEQQYTNYEAQRAELNKGLTPPDPTSREDTDTQLAKLDEGINIPAEYIEPLKTTFGMDLYGVAQNMLQSNPTAIIETIVSDLYQALTTANPEDGLPFEVMKGDYIGHSKLRLGNNEYNLPTNTAMMIKNRINAKLRGDVSGRIEGAIDEFGNRLQRGIAGAQTEKLLGRPVPNRGNNPNWQRDMRRGPIPTQ